MLRNNKKNSYIPKFSLQPKNIVHFLFYQSKAHHRHFLFRKIFTVIFFYFPTFFYF